MWRYISQSISKSHIKMICFAILSSVAVPSVGYAQNQIHVETISTPANRTTTQKIGYIPLESFHDFDFQTVNDFTQTLNANEISLLDKKIRAIYNDNIMQIGIVIVPTTADTPIFDYAMSVANSWQLGSDKDSIKANNGLLILIAKNDKQMYILTGTGIEASLRDEEVAQVIKKDIVPQFAKGKYYAGLSVGIDALVKELYRSQ